jgi:hypothetical protein
MPIAFGSLVATTRATFAAIAAAGEKATRAVSSLDTPLEPSAKARTVAAGSAE